MEPQLGLFVTMCSGISVEQNEKKAKLAHKWRPNMCPNEEKIHVAHIGRAQAAGCYDRIRGKSLGFDCSAYLLYTENLDLCVSSGLPSETEKG